MKTTIKSACLIAAMAMAGSATAAQTLRVADSLPVDHYISGNLIKPWMERVTELTNGEIKFEYYPAEQMGKAKDLLTLLQSGAIDVAYIGVTYAQDKLPLAAVGELPEAFTSSCTGSKAYWQLAKPGAILDEQEFAKQDVRMLMEMVLAPYQLMTAKKDISSLDAVKGLKIRATGGTKELAIEKLHATPISIPAPETREALSRGTVDGVLFPFSSAIPYGLAPVLKYSTHGINLGSFIASYMINQNLWDSLDKETQDAMTQAATEIMPKACAAVDEQDKKDEQKMAAEGTKIVDTSDADLEKLQTELTGIGEDWAAHLDKQGKPGSEVLKQFRAALEDADNS